MSRRAGVAEAEGCDQSVGEGRSALASRPSAAATVAGTSSASASGARSTQTMPSAKCAATSWAMAWASRVLPTPPGPVSVRSGTASQEQRADPGKFRLPADEPGSGDEKRGGKLGGDGSDHAGILRVYLLNTM